MHAVHMHGAHMHGAHRRLGGTPPCVAVPSCTGSYPAPHVLCILHIHRIRTRVAQDDLDHASAGCARATYYRTLQFLIAMVVRPAVRSCRRAMLHVSRTVKHAQRLEMSILAAAGGAGVLGLWQSSGIAVISLDCHRSSASWM